MLLLSRIVFVAGVRYVSQSTGGGGRKRRKPPTRMTWRALRDASMLVDTKAIRLEVSPRTTGALVDGRDRLEGGVLDEEEVPKIYSNYPGGAGE